MEEENQEEQEEQEEENPEMEVEFKKAYLKLTEKMAEDKEPSKLLFADRDLQKVDEERKVINLVNKFFLENG